jgi:tartrate/fumarate subfamily iron-sulfur-dependent hydro-lyase alpha chain
MFTEKKIESAMYEAMRLAATRMPQDVKAALGKAVSEETEPLAVAHLKSCLKNAEAAESGKGLVCGDTGFPLFFVKIAPDAKISGGIPSLFKAAQQATAKATADSFLRPTMVDPLTRKNSGNNLGPGMPKVEISFDGKDGQIEIIAAPKGGGSEIFGTFFRMLFPSDGRAGIKKFVIECIRDSCYAGKICPPAIIGVGIGGTADLCMRLAKEAALLRVVGKHNPDAETAELETELLNASRMLGIGPMGSRGINCVMALNIEKAVTHTAALPVAVNAQCLVGRRWKAVITSGGKVSFSDDISNWKEME